MKLSAIYVQRLDCVIVFRLGLGNIPRLDDYSATTGGLNDRFPVMAGASKPP